MNASNNKGYKYLVVVRVGEENIYFPSNSMDGVKHVLEQNGKYGWVYDREGWLVSRAGPVRDGGAVKRLPLNLDGLPRMAYAEMLQFINQNRDLSMRYRLLDRMRSDCEYYLGAGNGQSQWLWGKAGAVHIQYMKLLWGSFSADEKPSWISFEDIVGFEQQMRQKRRSLNDQIREARMDVSDASPRDVFGKEEPER